MVRVRVRVRVRVWVRLRLRLRGGVQLVVPSHRAAVPRLPHEPAHA